MQHCLSLIPLGCCYRDCIFSLSLGPHCLYIALLAYLFYYINITCLSSLSRLFMAHLQPIYDLSFSIISFIPITNQFTVPTIFYPLAPTIFYPLLNLLAFSQVASQTSEDLSINIHKTTSLSSWQSPLMSIAKTINQISVLVFFVLPCFEYLYLLSPLWDRNCLFYLPLYRTQHNGEVSANDFFDSMSKWRIGINLSLIQHEAPCTFPTPALIPETRRTEPEVCCCCWGR